MRKLNIAIFGLLFFLGLWQLLVSIFSLPRFILPGPWDVVLAFVDHAEFIMGHAAITALEVVVGFALGCLFGMANALMIINSPFARRYVFPVLVASQAVPVFAIAPILTLWFGFGVASKIIMTMLVIYFPVTSNFLDGLSRTPRPMLEMASVMGGTPRNMLLHVRIPMALPSLVSGIRLAAILRPSLKP
jgi:ABC-type nitrate/sulfonate/bicarbonate transport system, permease component